MSSSRSRWRNSSEAAWALVATARRAGVVALVGHHRRYYPAVRQARKIVTGGEIGRFVGASVIWATMKSDDYFVPIQADGPIMNNFSHEVDLLRYICGEIVDRRWRVTRCAASRSRIVRRSSSSSLTAPSPLPSYPIQRSRRGVSRWQPGKAGRSPTAARTPCASSAPAGRSSFSQPGLVARERPNQSGSASCSRGEPAEVARHRRL